MTPSTQFDEKPIVAPPPPPGPGRRTTESDRADAESGARALTFGISVVIRLAIVAALGVGVWSALTWMAANAPEQQKWPVVQPEIAVDAMTVHPRDFQVIVTSQGTVEERTRSRLIPQVSGRVEWISPRLLDGSFFEAGDELVRIERFDYEREVAVANAALAQAKLRLAEEEARAAQAIEDWEKLGTDEEAPELVRRVPQLNEARAAVASAQARVELAERNLERTSIEAPYAGVVMEKMVDVGQVVSPGAALAEVFAIDYAEIRVPLPDAGLAFLDLPETYRGEQPTDAPPGPKAIVRATVGGREHEWEARVVRTEASFDVQSRMLKVVVQVDDPYGRTESGRPPLKRGEYVVVDIYGITLEDVYVLPRTAVRRTEEVLVIDGENRIRPRLVKPIYSDDEHLVVREGLEPGEVISLTNVLAAAGSQVFPTVDGELRLTDAQRQAKEEAARSRGQGGWGGGRPGGGGAPAAAARSGGERGGGERGGWERPKGTESDSSAPAEDPRGSGREQPSPAAPNAAERKGPHDPSSEPSS